MESNAKSSPIDTELFLRGRKLSILLALRSQFCFKVLKTMKLNIILSCKFLTREDFNKYRQIICLKLILKIS